eukprot:1340491-Rhodomonas_salina.1
MQLCAVSVQSVPGPRIFAFQFARGTSQSTSPAAGCFQRFCFFSNEWVKMGGVWKLAGASG